MRFNVLHLGSRGISKGMYRSPGTVRGYRSTRAGHEARGLLLPWHLWSCRAAELNVTRDLSGADARLVCATGVGFTGRLRCTLKENTPLCTYRASTGILRTHARADLITISRTIYSDKGMSLSPRATLTVGNGRVQSLYYSLPIGNHH